MFKMDKITAINLINSSTGRTPCDLVIRNVFVVDVLGNTTKKEDVYITDGFIVGFDEKRKAKKEIDGENKYLVPGFIDSHCHIESSHLSPSEFSNAVLPCGTTTVIADPHEICNVKGLDALSYMLKSAKDAYLDIYYMFPSCVPCTSFEHSGAILNRNEIEKMIDSDRILGLGEMMNYVGVVNCDETVMDKLDSCYSRRKIIDGHIPSISGQNLDAYLCAGIKTDHECETPEELREKITKGMYVLLRQGTVCRNVLQLLPGVDDYNYKRCLFCTDDRQPQSIRDEGHINYAVNLAIENGMDPIRAIACATINAAECYHLDDRGAITPGRRADFFLTDSLEKIKPTSVFVKGEEVARNNLILLSSPHVEPFGVESSVIIKDLSLETFSLPLKTNKARVIDIQPGGVVTKKGTAIVKRDENGEWLHDEDEDILKVTVIERHNATGCHASGLIRGYGLKHGAIATTIAHDSHNIIVVGDNDSDMLSAVKKLSEIGGGITAFIDSEEVGTHKLEIGGLMTDLPVLSVAKELDELHKNVEEKMGGVNKEIDPFMTLCFMALPVIPAYKITDCGLFDVTEFKFVDVSINE